MSSRAITDEDVIESLVQRGYAGEADEFDSTDDGAVARHGKVVVVELDGTLMADEWDTESEAAESYDIRRREIGADRRGRPTPRTGAGGAGGGVECRST